MFCSKTFATGPSKLGNVIIFFRLVLVRNTEPNLNLKLYGETLKVYPQIKIIGITFDGSRTKSPRTKPPGQNLPDKIPLDKIPPGTKSPGQNPPGQNPPWDKIPRTKSPWTKPPDKILPLYSIYNIPLPPRF